MRTKIKVAITKNGVAFDTPSRVSINRSSNIPSCTIVFPRRIGSRFLATKNDCIRLYVGIGSAPNPATDFPVFTGFMESERGFDETEYELYGIMSRCMKEYVKVDDSNNYDGNEISTAILSVLKSINTLQRPGVIQSKFMVQKSDPTIKVPDGTRSDRGISKWELIRQFADMTKDERNMNIRNYALFEFGDDIYFRKEPDAINGLPHITMSYGTSLINFEETDKGNESINKIMVIGKDGVSSSFQNDHRINVDGLREGEPVNDNNITTAGVCNDIARLIVQSRLFDNYGITMESKSLLHAIPDCTLIQIVNAPYGLNGKYIVRESMINITPDSFDINAVVSKPTESVGDAIAKALGLNRDLYPGSLFV
jgi:hypothetical protein